jgi:inhibitor of KinA
MLQKAILARDCVEVGKRVSIYKRPRMSPLGDCAVVIAFGDEIDEAINRRVKAFWDRLAAASLPAIVELIPTFTNVTIIYDPLRTSHQDLIPEIGRIIEALPAQISGAEARTIEIPVCYGGDFGPVLESVAEHNDLSPDVVVAIHGESTYPVYMIGFAPGFPYLGGVSERISAPRLDTPREKIPAGSVGIAGRQTGVYPIETPGGWRLIGRTPLRLFNPVRDPPSLLQAGDLVRFTAINKDQYERTQDEES